jgi:filamentous hemagglutinin family protein
MKITQFILFSVSSFFLSNILINPLLKAQVIPDNTLPNNSIVNQADLTYILGGGTEAGSNLFHSFEKFSLPANHKIFFDNPVNIQNIFTRVTGNSISNINGLIQSRNATNLFLINPNGIIFGNGFDLRIGGSFLGSTANSIKFENGQVFSTNVSDISLSSSLLSVNVPVGLQFNNSPSAIEVKGSSVNLGTGKDMVLVGGNISLEFASLKTIGGRIELGSISQAGMIGLDVNENNLRLQLPDNLSRYDISLKEIFINVEAGFDDFKPNDVGTDGSIRIFARNLNIENSEMNAGIADIPEETLFHAAFVNQISLLYSSGRTINDYKEIFTGIGGLGSDGIQGGDITIDATEVIYIKESIITNQAGLYAPGNGGNIYIRSGSSILTDGTRIETISKEEGNAGNISVLSIDNLLIDNTYIGSRVDTNSVLSEANSGNLVFNSRSLLADNNTRLEVRRNGSGTLGNVDINTSENLSFINQSGVFIALGENELGNTINDLGNINIETNSLSLNDGSFLQTFIGIASNKNTANININANNSISLLRDSLISSEGFGRDSDSGGTINLNTRFFSLGEGSQIRTSSSIINPPGPPLPPLPLFFLNYPLFAEKSNTLANININATESVSLWGASTGLFSRIASGSGGNITINTESLKITDNAVINADSNESSGGNINLQLGNLQLRNNSGISTTAGRFGAGGNGGNITIYTDILAALENSDIRANAFEGSGGNIQITTQGDFRSPDSEIDASSQFGLDGTVTFNILGIDPTSSLLKLPENLVDATRLVDRRCTPSNPQQSSFIDIGRGGKQPTPRDPLSSNGGWVDPNFSQVSTTAPVPTDAIVEAQGWIFNERGQIVLVAETDTATPDSFLPTPRCGQ